VTEDNPSNSPPRPRIDGLTIVVLDDRLENAVGMKRAIEHLGAVAYVAEVAEEAKRLIAVHQPDCVIVDFILNGHGLALIDDLRAAKLRLAIVLTSAHDVPAAMELPAGVVFLPKPFVLEQMASVILDAIGRLDTDPPPPDTERS